MAQTFLLGFTRGEKSSPLGPITSGQFFDIGVFNPQA